MIFTFPIFKRWGMDAGGYGIKRLRVFAQLSNYDIQAIERKARLVEYKKGDVICREGEASGNFYVILAGRCRFFRKDESGRDRAVKHLYRYDYFGEMPLLTGGAHSASVEALSDTIVLEWGKKDFDYIVKTYPPVSLEIGRILERGLRDESSGRTSEVRIASVWRYPQGLGAKTFLVSMASMLEHDAKKRVVVVLSSHFLKDFLSEGARPRFLSLRNASSLDKGKFEEYLFSHPSRFSVLFLDERDLAGDFEKEVGRLLSSLVGRFDVVLFGHPQEFQAVSRAVIKQSDAVYLLTDGEPSHLERCRVVIDELCRSCQLMGDEIRLLISEAQYVDRTSLAEKERFLKHKVFYYLPHTPDLRNFDLKQAEPYVLKFSDTSYARSIRYISRELCGNLIGLALGSGAAHGLAHVGVIKVLEEEGIDIDIIASSSMGSFVGSLWAAGYKAKELEIIGMSLRGQKGLLRIFGVSDVGLPKGGFLKGRGIVRFLRGFLDKKTFRDLKIPLCVLATDLNTSEEVVFEDGDVVDAVRASVTIPGVMYPHKLNGRYYIDGGVVNPLPISVLAKRGVRKIIAVNVFPSPEDYIERDEILKVSNDEIERRIRKKALPIRWFWLTKKWFLENFGINAFNVLMNTLLYMGYGMARQASAEADVVIHPVICDAFWGDFFSPEKFFKVGEEKTREKLDEIKKLVYE
ncbi:MAG: patatin-like phospholipase family protein [Candidatus Omnitrophica bacterium]|nr:patatin-like phospholipase family protein [Candidatus Omnitrophota bacterium]